MAEKKEKAQYEAPTSQQDLAERQKEGWEPGTVVPGDTSVSPLDNGGFVGVDPIYQNAANKTDEPMRTTEGPEAVLFDALYDDEDDEDDEPPAPKSPSSPPAPPAPNQ